MDSKHHILAALGAPETAVTVLNATEQLASAIPDSAVHVCRVLPRDVLDEQAPDAVLAVELTRARLLRARERLQRSLGRDVEILLRYGEPAEQLLHLCHELDVRFLILGPVDRPPWPRRLFGSVAERMLWEAPCSVVLARPTPAHAR